MGKKAFFRLSLRAAIVGTVLLAGLSVQAADQQAIWSVTSPLLNQSTEALADGRQAHAIRFAKGVLRTKTNAADHLIARQNLCLAHLARGERDEAQPYCDAALAAVAKYQVVERDGRRVIATAETANDPTAPSLEATVRANVARAQGNELAQNR